MKWLSFLLLFFGAVAEAQTPPPSKTVPVGYVLTISWGAVTTYVNGLPLTTKPDYKLYSMNNPSLPGFLGYVGNVLSTTRTMTTAGTFCYAVSVQVWDPNANESTKSPTVCVLVQNAPPPPQTSPPVDPTPVCVK